MTRSFPARGRRPGRRRRRARRVRVRPRRSSSLSAVRMSRAPVAPTGWPSAIAPPLTFSFSSGIGAEALLHGEHLRGESFVDLNDIGVGGLQSRVCRSSVRSRTPGPSPCARDRSRHRRKPKSPSGLKPSSAARCSVMTSRATAPSVICEELPAVTVPYFSKTGRRPPSTSSD